VLLCWEDRGGGALGEETAPSVRRLLEEDAGVVGTVSSGARQERVKAGPHVRALREWAMGARRRTAPWWERVREHRTYEGPNKGNGSHDVRLIESRRE
jgi:hypothetical protein